jgi:phosphopantothenoylcysteine decarboxylase / phosphopantothenate---cysteine ligase
VAVGGFPHGVRRKSYLNGRGGRTLGDPRVQQMIDDAAGKDPQTIRGPLVRRQITLCVSGSIAAYKAVLVVRALLRAGAIVQPVMTRSARRFVGAATLSGLTGRTVYEDMFRAPGELHVSLGRESVLIVVVPATADLLARLANGHADDLVTATLLCARCPVLIAPAMHPRMWEHPATRRNLEHLRQTPNWTLLEPTFGEVASGEAGVGRMVEPEVIVAAIERVVALEQVGSSPSLAESARSLSGRHVVVTAGPTVEDIDPVRFLTNRSSGKMGFAIARSAVRWGARVTLIAGPVALDTPAGVTRVDVRSALEMQAALVKLLGEGLRGADALVMCAAVSDYRVRAASPTKLKRSANDLQLDLVPNPDLLADIGRARSGRSPFLLGFAVETEQGERLEQSARQKLQNKRVDGIVANAAIDALGTDDIRALIVTADATHPLSGSKQTVGEEIVEFLAARLA